MILHLGPSVKKVILALLYKSWKSGTVPALWKKATLIPFYKKRKYKKHPSSYRPISILSCLGKLLERIINTRLMAHLEANNILSPTQSGYGKHRSTEDQLALLAQVIAQKASPYGPRVGCIRSSPYGHAHKGPIWDPDSKPIWDVYGLDHMGTSL